VDSKNHKKQIGHVVLSTILSLIIVFVGLPLISAIGVENTLSKALLLVLIVGSYSTLYLR
jgi:hypothetical protein